MASSSDAIFGVTTAQVTIPTGATNAVLVASGPGVRAFIIKYASGGSVSIFGNPQLIPGATSSISTTFSTLGLAALVTGFSNSYLLGTSEVLSFGGPCQLYVAATGSTAIVYLMQGLSSSGNPSGSF